MNFWARTVVLEDAAERIARTARAQKQSFETAFDGLQWLLARNPNQGIRRRLGGVDVHVYVQGSDSLADTPEIWVVFSHDPDQVIIHAINVSY